MKNEIVFCVQREDIIHRESKNTHAAQLNVQISQGSAAADLRWGGKQ